MSSSTIATATATADHICDAASWCASHTDVPDCPGFVVHLSELEAGGTGVVTGIKAYTWNGEPTGRAQILTFTPLPGTPATPEQWRMDWLRTIAAA